MLKEVYGMHINNKMHPAATVSYIGLIVQTPFLVLLLAILATDKY